MCSYWFRQTNSMLIEVNAFSIERTSICQISCRFSDGKLLCLPRFLSVLLFCVWHTMYLTESNCFCTYINCAPIFWLHVKRCEPVRIRSHLWQLTSLRWDQSNACEINSNNSNYTRRNQSNAEYLTNERVSLCKHREAIFWWDVSFSMGVNAVKNQIKSMRSKTFLIKSIFMSMELPAMLLLLASRIPIDGCCCQC